MAFFRHLLEYGKEKGISKKAFRIVIQELYALYLDKPTDHYSVRKIRHLQAITGIKPKIDSVTVQKTYESCLGAAHLEDMAAKTIRDMTRIKPRFSAESAQKIYDNQIDHGWVGHLVTPIFSHTKPQQTLVDFLGVAPRIDSDRIKKVYNQFMTNPHFGGSYELKFKLESWKNITGVDLSAHNVMRAYVQCLEGKGMFTSSKECIEQMLILHDATKVPLQLPYVVANLMYGQCAIDRDISMMEKIIAVTSVHPDDNIIEFARNRCVDERDLANLERVKTIADENMEFAEESSYLLSTLNRSRSVIREKEESQQRELQREYARCVTMGKVNDLTFLQKITGINPSISEEVVQRAYRKNAKQGNWEVLEQLIEFTRVKPKFEGRLGKKICERALSTNVNDRRLTSLKVLSQSVKTDITFSTQLVQEEYRSSRSKEKVDLIYRATGIAPTRETMQLIYHTLATSPYIDLEGSIREWDSVREIPLLKKLTRIRPHFENKKVQEEYVSNIRDSSIERIKVINKLTRIRPTKATIQKGYNALVSSFTDYGTIIPRLSCESDSEELKKLLGVEPDLTVYDAFIDTVFKEHTQLKKYKGDLHGLLMSKGT